jgi:hypothetical protein
MQDGKNRNTVANPVLREALARIEQRKRCAFPHHGYGNWRDWCNWRNVTCGVDVFGNPWCNTWCNVIWINWLNGQ